MRLKKHVLRPGAEVYLTPSVKVDATGFMRRNTYSYVTLDVRVDRLCSKPFETVVGIGFGLRWMRQEIEREMGRGDMRRKSDTVRRGSVPGRDCGIGGALTNQMQLGTREHRLFPFSCRPFSVSPLHP